MKAAPTSKKLARGIDVPFASVADLRIAEVAVRDALRDAGHAGVSTWLWRKASGGSELAADALEKGRKGRPTDGPRSSDPGRNAGTEEVIVGAAQAELVLLERRVNQLRAATEAVPSFPEWAELMAQAVISLASRLNDATEDPVAFGSVVTSLGVRVRATEFANRPNLEVTATITRAALQDLIGNLGDVAQRCPARQSLALLVAEAKASE